MSVLDWVGYVEKLLIFSGEFFGYSCDLFLYFHWYQKTKARIFIVQNKNINITLLIECVLPKNKFESFIKGL